MALRASRALGVQGGVVSARETAWGATRVALWHGARHRGALRHAQARALRQSGRASGEEPEEADLEPGPGQPEFLRDYQIDLTTKLRAALAEQASDRDERIALAVRLAQTIAGEALDPREHEAELQDERLVVYQCPRALPQSQPADATPKRARSKISTRGARRRR